MTAADDDLLTEMISPFGFEATLARVAEAIEAAGLTIFARIDHAENAQKAGLVMPPTMLMIYGNAKGGTPLMLAEPRAALDLPLRVLVREAEQSTVVAFHPMAPILLRAGVPESLAHRLDPAQRMLAQAIQS
jgi:uncharacterized protein (DUF302 family)